MLALKSDTILMTFIEVSIVNLLVIVSRTNHLGEDATFFLFTDLNSL